MYSCMIIYHNLEKVYKRAILLGICIWLMFFHFGKYSYELKRKNEKVEQISQIQKELLKTFSEMKHLLESYCNIHYESMNF